MAEANSRLPAEELLRLQARIWSNYEDWWSQVIDAVRFNAGKLIPTFFLGLLVM